MNITEVAKAKMVSVLQEENKNYLRFGLKGSGCAGFSYFFNLEDDSDIAEDDMKIELGAEKTMVIDSMSLMYVDEAIIDYVKDAMGEKFTFANPKSTGSCGCGQSTSFS